MTIRDILTLERTYFGVTLKSKKKILEFIAEMAASAYPGLVAEDVFDALFNRERIGSTALGFGVALPHARLPYLNEALGLLIKLREGVPFDSEDNEAVDLVFALLVPEEATTLHLETLAELAEKFRNAEFRTRLRSAPNAEVLYALTCR